MKTKIRKESSESKICKSILFFMITVIFLTITFN